MGARPIQGMEPRVTLALLLAVSFMLAILVVYRIVTT